MLEHTELIKMQLEEEDMPLLESEDHVRVQVLAAGVNPVDTHKLDAHKGKNRLFIRNFKSCVRDIVG